MTPSAGSPRAARHSKPKKRARRSASAARGGTEIGACERVAERDVARAERARRCSGEIICWGDNSRGQLGDGTYAARHGLVSTGIMDAVRLDSRSYHTCARRLGGDIVCWGVNDRGQLGDGTTTESAAPRTVVGL